MLTFNALLSSSKTFDLIFWIFPSGHYLKRVLKSQQPEKLVIDSAICLF